MSQTGKITVCLSELDPNFIIYIKKKIVCELKYLCVEAVSSFKGHTCCLLLGV